MDGFSLVPGFRAHGVSAGLKSSGGLDFALLLSNRPCAAAGVFTQNDFAAAPVLLSRSTLLAAGDAIRAVVINAGNANACTGEQGMQNALSTQRMVAEALGLAQQQVLVLSTGVIGEALPIGLLRSALPSLVGGLSERGGQAFAEAILTTDTKTKTAALRVELPEGVVSLAGVAKGSGMIHPNMATMLSVLTTDLAIAKEPLQEMLSQAVETSFNAISVDGDTSTNDAVLLLANAASGIRLQSEQGRRVFQQALSQLCHLLALEIVRDGEGVHRIARLEVCGAGTRARAREVAKRIAISPLFKTALAGADPNWGRVLGAAGNAGAGLDFRTITLELLVEDGSPMPLLRKGQPIETTTEAQHCFAQKEVALRLDLGGSEGSWTQWTSDFTEGYIRINADYRS